MNNLEKLDTLLETLYSFSDSENSKKVGFDRWEKYFSVPQSKIIENFLKKNYHLNLSELILLSNKLKEDKFIERKISVNEVYEYAITFDGVYFWETEGGYTKRKSNKDFENRREMRMQEATILLTVLLTIGTLGLLIFEIFKFCYYIHH